MALTPIEVSETGGNCERRVATPTSCSLLPAHLRAADGDLDRPGRLDAVPRPLHPHLYVLPLHTRNPHHHPPAPVHLPLHR